MSLDKKQCIFTQQPDAYLSQANPVSATWYTVLNTVQNARITSIAARIAWATTQPTPLEVRVTVDGQTIIFTQTDPVTATYYCAQVLPSGDAASQIFNSALASAHVLVTLMLEGRSVKVEVRITWATTQPTPLVCRVKYAKL